MSSLLSVGDSVTVADEENQTYIYMFNELFIGVELENKMAKISMNKGDESKNPSSLKVQITTTLMDIMEQVVEDREIVEYVNLARLEILNLEKTPTWMGPEPSPSTKYLEMMILEEEGLQIMNKNANKLKKGVKIPFLALYRHHRIYKTHIKAVDKRKFHIRVDSNYYGPFVDIEVKPLEINQKNHIFLPVMAFSPVSEVA